MVMVNRTCLEAWWKGFSVLIGTKVEFYYFSFSALMHRVGVFIVAECSYATVNSLTA